MVCLDSIPDNPVGDVSVGTFDEGTFDDISVENVELPFEEIEPTIINNVGENSYKELSLIMIGTPSQLYPIKL